MSKQKHDLGNKKRRHAESRPTSSREIQGQAMARSLIERGLASKRILDAYGTTKRKERP